MKQKLKIFVFLFISVFGLKTYADENIVERTEVVRFNQLLDWAEAEFSDLFPGPQELKFLLNTDAATKTLFPYDWVYRQYNATGLAIGMDKHKTVYLFLFTLKSNGDFATIKIKNKFGNLDDLIGNVGLDIENLERTALANEPLGGSGSFYYYCFLLNLSQ